tara:strand:- start:378 stop:857 length:480 start_codon:yes stop_codon:yes gene_type:complete
MKICSTCGESKELSEFHRKRKAKDGLSYTCKSCVKERNNLRYSKDKDKFQQQVARYRKTSPANILLSQAKLRARKGNYPFNLTLEDINIPTHCPVYPWIALEVGGKDINTSPSIDKYIPKLGYVKGNICVISHRANTHKSDSTRQEIELLLQWMLKQEA